MITNASLTHYHKTLDETTRLEKWIRHNYGTKDKNTVWWYGGKGSGINKGYENANDCDIRIWYEKNDNLNIANFSIGDIVIKGTLDADITRQQDLNSYEVYNITSINDNNFGINPHIHLGGK